MAFPFLNPTEPEDSLLDEFGRPVEMNTSEKKALEEAEYAERLQFAVAENQAFLALGGRL